MSKNNIVEKINSKKAVVSIVGLGYVGLPLILAFAKAGFRTIGIDISEGKVAALKKGKSYIDDVADDEVGTALKSGHFSVSSDFKKIKESDCVVICVPTPLGKTKEPDLSYVLSAVDAIAPNLKKNQLLVLESTTFPGTTDEVIAPRIEQASGLKAEQGVLIGFSPERVDPANRNWKIVEIPKVVGGIGTRSLSAVEALYRQVFVKVVPVSSTKAAEMVKLLENTFRSINIGLINEMAMICDALKVDVWEVIEAAATKPFGFMPFYPGPGIGGHCINIDSMYLAWKARLHGYEPKLIELAQAINDGMPSLVIDKAFRILNERKKSVNGSKVLVVGVAYKKNISDTRESPAGAIIAGLMLRGAKVKYTDPHVPDYRISDTLELKSVKKVKEEAQKSDLIIIVTDHENFNYKNIVTSKNPILDTRNALKKLTLKTKLIYKL